MAKASDQVAVVVDTFAEARQRDVLNLAEEMEYNHAADQKFLENIFQRIDADGSGQVTFDELLEGARKDPEFQSPGPRFAGKLMPRTRCS